MWHRASSCPPTQRGKREVKTIHGGRSCNVLELNMDEVQESSVIIWNSLYSLEDAGSCRTSVPSPLLPRYYFPGMDYSRSISMMTLQSHSHHLIPDHQETPHIQRFLSLNNVREERMMESQSSSFTMSNFPFNYCSYGCPCHNMDDYEDQVSTTEDQLSTTDSTPVFYFVPQIGYGLSISMPCLAARNIRSDIIRTRSISELNRPDRSRAMRWWIFRALLRHLLQPDDASVSSNEDWEGWYDGPRRRYDDYDDDRDGDGANYWFDTDTAPAA